MKGLAPRELGASSRSIHKLLRRVILGNSEAQNESFVVALALTRFVLGVQVLGGLVLLRLVLGRQLLFDCSRFLLYE